MDVWIFGYGSLIWRPGFDFEESEFATLNGWRRSFQQASPDHRGTQEAPGRVLTITQAAGARCIGKVFRVSAGEWPTVLRYLEVRESGGYEALQVEVTSARGNLLAWTWVASSENRYFVKSETFEKTIEVMLSAEGESGLNLDYVLNLETALNEAGIIDEEVSRFAYELRMRISEASSD